MTALDNGTANMLMDGILGTASFTATTGPLKCRLVKTTPTATSNGTNMTGMTAQTVTFGASAGEAAGTSVTMTFSGLTVGEVCLGVELWDSAGTPKRKMFDVLNTPKTVDATGTLVFPAGALTPAFL